MLTIPVSNRGTERLATTGSAILLQLKLQKTVIDCRCCNVYPKEY